MLLGECYVGCQCATQSSLREDDKGTFLPKTIFNITEKNKSLLNMANGILQSMTKAEKVIQLLIT